MSSVLARIDAWWSRLEVALAVAVAAALCGTLLLWVSLKGLASVSSEANVAGVVFRAAAAGGALAILAWALTSRLTERQRTWVTCVSLVLGAAVGIATAQLGTAYFSNLQGWLQDGSSFTLLGGVRGVGTRLTLWLTMLGASLATATGRHVSIDVVTRAFGPQVRRAVLMGSGLLSAVLCVAVAWGFFDFIAVDAFGAPREAPVSQKFASVERGVARHSFLARRQLALDAHVLGSVVAGHPWSQSLPVGEYNAWLSAAEWSAYFEAPPVPEDASDATRTVTPLVPCPNEAPRGLLVKSFNLIIPLGFLMVALRFLLWVARGMPMEGAHGVSVDTTGAAS